MTAQVQEARAAGADVLFVYGIGPELAALANSLERIGWKVDLLGGWTISMEGFIKNAGPSLSILCLGRRGIHYQAKIEASVCYELSQTTIESHG